MSRKRVFWFLCLAGTPLAVALVAVLMFVGGDRRVLMVGAIGDAHHQIGMACESCHAAPIFASRATAIEAMNETCRNCHEDELRAAADSHDGKLFRGPRMAVYREKLDVRLCTSCHVEHRPELTRAGAVTVALDFCIACHSEGDQDVRQARPSHAGLDFASCASAGCHNFHDNRALYQDFLIAHAGRPWLAPDPVHKLSARYRSRQIAGVVLAPGDAVAPAAALADAAALDHWAASGHAAAGVNCAGCHAPDAAPDAALAEIEALWVTAPESGVCAGCHRPQMESFARGRHGMRWHPQLAAPRDPNRRLEAIGLGGVVPQSVAAWLADSPLPAHMTAAEARLPMHADGGLLDCGTCHLPHAVDTGRAVVEACLTCHDDSHSRAYTGSVHHALWLAEQAGEAPPGSGVSCATCHMAKSERDGEIVTDHNQNDTLRPNEKAIRPVCLDCHGLGFALDALADGDLIARNFQGRPTVRVESISWALRHAAQAGR